MAMYEIQIYDQGQLDDLSDETREQVIEEIENAAQHRNPNSYRNAEKLSTHDDLFKIRVGRHRIIFGVVSPYLVVFRVGYRGDSWTYRDLNRLEDLWDQVRAEVEQATAPTA